MDKREPEQDKYYMRRAIALAKTAEGFTNPNPMVGAVIVKDGEIISEACHERWGQFHAERNAINRLNCSAKGATIYVTLEPCCHYGKTPPCTEAIIESGISRVVIGSPDPNPLVAGKGVAILREHGIRVEENFLRDECDAINPVFFHYIINKMPYVTLKYAMTADGKIATKSGASKWITGEKAREKVQYMRHKNRGIMAGIGTVLADDPMLNVRVEGLRSPVRIICDSQLRIPPDSRIVQTAKEFETIVACAVRNPEKEKALNGMGVQVLYAGEEDSKSELEKKADPGKEPKVDLQKLLVMLGQQNIDSILVEGGGILNDSLLRLGLVHRMEVFIAPKVFGGKDAKSPVEGEGVSPVEEAAKFHLEGMEQIGEDVLLSYVKEK